VRSNFVGLVSLLFEGYYILIVVRILMSWFPRVDNDFIRFVIGLTDPLLNYFRKILPRVGMLDFSPLVAVIALDLAKTILLNILIKIGL